MLKASEVGFSYSCLRQRWVFRAFSWEVPPGKTTLLIGPNGAGKSTLLRLLSGYERPSEGTVTFCGNDQRNELYANVGWMPQNIQAAPGLRAQEQIEYASWAAGASRLEARRLAAQAIDLVDLGEQSAERADQLSGGQVRRLGLAQAYVRHAPVLLLDEPTAGLDPAQSQNFLRILRSLKCPGGIVVSSHQVLDLADHVDQVAVLDSGEMRFQGSSQQFRDFGVQIGVDSGSFAEIFSAMCRGESR